MLHDCGSPWVSLVCVCVCPCVRVIVCDLQCGLNRDMFGVDTAIGPMQNQIQTKTFRTT